MLNKFNVKLTEVQTPTGVQYHVDNIDTGLDISQYYKEVDPIFFRKSTLATEIEDRLVIFMDDGFCRSFFDSLDDYDLSDNSIRESAIGNSDVVAEIQVGRVYPLSVIETVKKYTLNTLKRLEEEKNDNE